MKNALLPLLSLITGCRLFGQTLDVTSTGVGIGTSSPGATLHVVGSTVFDYTGGINYVSLRSHNGGGNYGSCLLFNDSGTNNVQIASTANNNLWFYNGANATMILTAGGYVGIGTTTPGYLLTVAGPVRASQFIADVNTYSDFVFKPGYKLASLAEVETAIKRDGHLPGIPAEADVKGHGVDLANQQAKLLQKVEELTLYLLAHEKDLAHLRQENAELRQKLTDFENR